MNSDEEEEDARLDINDPAFASLNDVQLPPGFEEEDEDMGGENVTGKGVGFSEANHIIEDNDDDDEEEEDLEDTVLRPGDNLIMVANTEDDFSSLEVHVYNEKDGSLYIHHDVTLPSYPLCLAWSDYAGDQASMMLTTSGSAHPEQNTYVGSFCAVGTFEPTIEIWNLDVMDPLEPVLSLKGNKPLKKKKTRGGASSSSAATKSSASLGHSDAVMGLSWNRQFRHMLASSSADGTVKVWDLDAGGSVLHTFGHHKGKVQSVAWNPAEGTVFASASYDRTIAVLDARAADKDRIARYSLPSDPESLAWYPHMPSIIAAACEDGSFRGFDCRMPDQPLWNVKAHSQAVTSFSFSGLAKGLVATASLDKTVKLWDIDAADFTGDASMPGATSAYAPVHLSTKSMGIGQVFTASFFPHNPYLLAAGGSQGMLAVWDTKEDPGDVVPAAELHTPNNVEGLAPGTGAIARRFHTRVRDTGTVPGLVIRPRADGLLA